MLGATPAGGEGVAPAWEAGGVDCGRVCAAEGGTTGWPGTTGGCPCAAGGTAGGVVWAAGGAADVRAPERRAAARRAGRELQAAVLAQPEGQLAV